MSQNLSEMFTQSETEILERNTIILVMLLWLEKNDVNNMGEAYKRRYSVH